MFYFMCVIAAGLLLFVFVLILGQEKKALENPIVGDLVFVRGPFDPDKGWVRGINGSPGMEEAPGQRGVVVEVDKSGCLVDLENGQCWHFAPESLVIL